MIRRLAPVLAAAVVAAVAAPAAAHVTVNPREANQGGYAKLAFRVPNERDDAGTTRLEVFFPEEHPLASVTVRPTPGWNYEIERQPLDPPVEREGGGQLTEFVSKITWDGGLVGVGEFQEFEISAGPLPEADRMVFRAIQTYESGEVVRWIEEPVGGGEEPERPAPVLQLVSAGDEDDAAAGGSGADGDPDGDDAAPDGEAAAPEGEAAAATGDDGTDPLAVVALAVALLAAGLGGLALGRSRRG